MGSRHDLHPRAPWSLRNLLSAQVLAHVLPSVPVGYWQRRVGARAFALDVLPAMPRASQHVSVTRQPGVPPIWMVTSEVMTWGVIPWIWRADPRSERADARAAVARVRAAARTPTCAAVFVASEADRTRLRHMAHLRLTGAASVVTVVGMISLEDIDAVLAEASADLGGRDGAVAIADALHRLRALEASAAHGEDARQT